MATEIWVAIIMAAGTILTQLVIAARTKKETMEIIDYRVGQLEKKVDKHNSVIERTYILEEKMKVANHRIDDLERGCKHG